MSSQVEIHVVTLSAVEPRPEVLEGRERARWERLRIEAKRRQFVAAQTALRTVLGRRTGLEPGEVRFGYGEHGKPYLPARPDLGFNMTHSGDRALIAVSDAADVGVDLEYLGRDRPFLRLAQRYFSAPEHEWLAALPEDRHRRAFYRTWVLKEAYLKAVGTGLTFPPSGFTLELQAEQPRVLATELPGDTPGGWSLRDLEIHRDYAAALCVRGMLERVDLRAF